MGRTVKSKSDQSIYFDACIYIAHYRKEVSSYGKPRIDAIAGLLEENAGGGTTIVTSSLTICEVIGRLKESNLDAEIEDFKNRFKFGLHKLKDVDPKVSERAALYRHYYRSHPVKIPHQVPKNDPVLELLRRARDYAGRNKISTCPVCQQPADSAHLSQELGNRISAMAVAAGPTPEQTVSNLLTPDAIHLATATIYECDELWTLDGLNPSPDKYQSVKPLWLNNKVANDSIIITAPSMPQGTFPLGV